MINYNDKEMTTGEFIRSRRLDIEMNAGELARLLGVDRRAVYEYETNLRPYPITEFDALMTALEIEENCEMWSQTLRTVIADNLLPPEVYGQRLREDNRRLNDIISSAPFRCCKNSLETLAMVKAIQGLTE